MMNIELLIQVLKEQIANPTRAVVNSEASFVQQKLHGLGESELAREYWFWVCRCRPYDLFGEEVRALQLELTNIDKKSKMPEWGYKGT